MTAMLPALAGSNFIYGMGMVDNGMAMCYEQLMIDCEIVRMIRRVLQGFTVDKESLMTDVIRTVGPGGTYLTQKSTRKLMRKEISRAQLFDRYMRGIWENKGSKDTYRRAREEALEHYKNYQVTPLAPEVSEKIREIIVNAEMETDREI